MVHHFMLSVVRVDAFVFPSHGPPFAVLAFEPTAAASHPASVTGEECGTSGLGPVFTPAAAPVAVLFGVAPVVVAAAASHPASVVG